MICGTTLNKTIQPYKPASGEMFGAGVAANELIRATLAAQDDLRWDFWTPGLQPSITAASGKSSFPPDLTHFRSQFGDRVTLRDCLSLPEVTRGQEYIFVTSVPLLSAIGELRQQLACESLPVCGLLHSAIFGDVISTYTWLSLSIKDGDALVASSRAGKIALERILQSARERIAQSTGAATALPEPRIVEIPLGVRVPPAEALERDRARSLLQMPEDCFAVLYLGRLTEMYKADLDFLLQAVAKISSGARNVRLILAGQHEDPSYSSHIRNRLALLHLAERTLLVENFPEFVKSAIFAACDVFVSPADSVQETFGLAVLEAMAHARPVIASSWSGYRDLVLDGETGFLLKTRWSAEAGKIASAVASLANPYEIGHYLAQHTLMDVNELASKLEQLADHPAAARNMGERGRARVSGRFSWPRVSQLFLSLWTEQIERAKSVSRPRHPFIDLNRFFAHYADEILTPDDLLTKSDGMPPLEGELADHWPFSDESQYEQIFTILELCEQGPVRVGTLHEKGLSSDCILWAAKKGLCGILSARGVQTR